MLYKFPLCLCPGPPYSHNLEGLSWGKELKNLATMSAWGGGWKCCPFPWRRGWLLWCWQQQKCSASAGICCVAAKSSRWTAAECWHNGLHWSLCVWTTLNLSELPLITAWGCVLSEPTTVEKALPQLCYQLALNCLCLGGTLSGWICQVQSGPSCHWHSAQLLAPQQSSPADSSRYWTTVVKGMDIWSLF